MLLLLLLLPSLPLQGDEIGVVVEPGGGKSCCRAPDEGETVSPMESSTITNKGSMLPLPVTLLPFKILPPMGPTNTPRVRASANRELGGAADVVAVLVVSRV